MITSWHGDIFRITWPFVRAISQSVSYTEGPVTRRFDFLCCKSVQAVELTVHLPVIWSAMTLVWRHCIIKCCIVNLATRYALYSPQSCEPAIPNQFSICYTRQHDYTSAILRHTFAMDLSLVPAWSIVPWNGIMRRPGGQRSLQWRHVRVMHTKSLATRFDVQQLVNRKANKKSMLPITGVFRGIHRWMVDSPHKGPFMWKTSWHHYGMQVIINHGLSAWRHLKSISPELYHWLILDKLWSNTHQRFFSWKALGIDHVSIWECYL